MLLIARDEAAGWATTNFSLAPRACARPIKVCPHTFSEKRSSPIRNQKFCFIDFSDNSKSSSLCVPSAPSRLTIMDLQPSRLSDFLTHSTELKFVHSLILSIDNVLGLPLPLFPFSFPSTSNLCSPSLRINSKIFAKNNNK